jgi:hypothetical protein
MLVQSLTAFLETPDEMPEADSGSIFFMKMSYLLVSITYVLARPSLSTG